MTIANPCLTVNRVLLLCFIAILGDQYYSSSPPPPLSPLLLLLLHIIIIMEEVEAQMNL